MLIDTIGSFIGISLVVVEGNRIDWGLSFNHIAVFSDIGRQR